MSIRTRVMGFLGFGKPNPAPISRRAYNGAMVSRLTSDWMSTQASADAEIRTNLRKLRDRSREMVRNNPYARQAKRKEALSGTPRSTKKLSPNGKFGVVLSIAIVLVAIASTILSGLLLGRCVNQGKLFFAFLGSHLAIQRCLWRCRCLKAIF